MSGNKKRNRKRIVSCVVLLLYACIFFTCSQPGVEDINRTTGPEELGIDISFYPGNEVIHYETHGLFSSTIVIPSLEAEITFYKISFYFDPSVITWESVFDQHALLRTSIVAPGHVVVYAYETKIPPGEYVELCTITWKAILTGFIDISAVATIKGEGTGGIPLQVHANTTGTVKIVKEIGSLSFDGSGYIQQGTAFSNRIFIDSEEKTIDEYDLDVYYDPSIIVPDTDMGDEGVEPGEDGFVTSITHGDGVITITGTSGPGMGPGDALEFLHLHWLAADSGRTNIFVVINKMVTTDNVYIKPRTRSLSVTIYTENKKPVVDVWFDPDTVNVNLDDPFMTSIYMDTVGYVLAAYGIDILYDPDVLKIDKSQAEGAGIEAGDDGFLTVSNALEPGVISTAGFDLNGVPPNPEVELLRVFWTAAGLAELSEITLDIRNLADVRTVPISRIKAFSCAVTVTE